MDNGQPDETKVEPQRYDQRHFMKTVTDLAKICATEHALATGDDALVTANTIISDLCANLITSAMVGDESGQLMVAITLKAEQQAAQIMEQRAQRISEEMDIVARLDGGWGRA